MGTEGLGTEVPIGVQGRAPVEVWGFAPKNQIQYVDLHDLQLTNA